MGLAGEGLHEEDALFGTDGGGDEACDGRVVHGGEQLVTPPPAGGHVPFDPPLLLLRHAGGDRDIELLDLTSGKELRQAVGDSGGFCQQQQPRGHLIEPVDAVEGKAELFGYLHDDARPGLAVEADARGLVDQDEVVVFKKSGYQEWACFRPTER